MQQIPRKNWLRARHWFSSGFGIIVKMKRRKLKQEAVLRRGYVNNWNERLQRNRKTQRKNRTIWSSKCSSKISLKMLKRRNKHIYNEAKNTCGEIRKIKNRRKNTRISKRQGIRIMVLEKTSWRKIKHS